MNKEVEMDKDAELSDKITLTKSSKYEEICCICLHNNSEIEFYPCHHAICCYECYEQLPFKGKDDPRSYSSNLRIYRECPICRSNTSRFRSLSQKIYHKIYDRISERHNNPEKENDIYKAIKSYLKICNLVTCDSKYPMVDILKSLVDIYTELNGSGYAVLLGVDKVEYLLQLGTNKNIYDYDYGFMLRHYLCSLCIKPWDIDGELGKEGICYHGNMGEIPSIGSLDEFYANNVSYLSGKFIFK